MLDAERESRRQRLGQLLDRLSYPIDERDIHATVSAFRRVAAGQTPSELLLHFENRASHARRIQALTRQMQELAATNQALQEKLASLQAAARPAQSNGDELTYAAVLQTIFAKFHKLNGAFPRWVRHSAALHAADPASPLLTLRALKEFRERDGFPRWAVAQLESLPGVPAPKLRVRVKDKGAASATEGSRRSAGQG